MQTQDLIVGFSDLKYALRTKAKLSKPLQLIRLWFTYDSGVLFVHDFEDHRKCIVLVIKESDGPIDCADVTKSVKIYLPHGSFGERVVRHYLESIEESKWSDALNKGFNLYGFRPFG